MRILLTGGTGFIGSHLLRELLLSGHDVVAVRRPQRHPPIRLCLQPTWLDTPILRLTLSDLKDIDVIIHLACAGVSPKSASLTELNQINILAGNYFLDLAIQSGVRRFVGAGTCFEYGSEADLWDRIPPSAALRPSSTYAASKAAGFLMLNANAIGTPIEFFYGRIFSAYGEGQYSANLWPSLREAALSGADFPMTSGFQVRDFIPVQLVARHLRIAAERQDLKPGRPLVVNIGSGHGLRVIDFAQEQWQTLDATGSLIPGAIKDRSGQITRLVADPINLLPQST